MSVEIADYIFQPSTLAPVVASVSALASAAMASTFLIPPLARKVLPQPKETRLADFLPFTEMHSDGRTIHLQNGGICVVVKFQGAELEIASESDYEAHFRSRRHWLTQLAEKKVIVRAFSVRTMIEPVTLQPHPVPIMRDLAKTWESSFQDSSFNTSHYAILSLDSKDMIALDEAISITTSSLNSFKPEVLSNKTAESPLKILGRLASPIARPAPHPFPGARVSEQITSDTIHFSDDKTGLITINRGPEKRFLGVVAIKSFGDFTEEKMMIRMATLPFEYICFHYIEPLNKTKGSTTLDLQFRLARTNLFTVSAHAQYDRVRELIGGGGEDTQCICKYGLNILVEASSEEELTRRISAISTIASDSEVTTVREGHAAQAVWFAQFPTHDTLPRPWIPLSANVATMLGFQRTLAGAFRSPLGEGPVTILRTSAGAPYNFVFHDMSDPSNTEPLSHMLVIGPSGSGKTFIIQWLTMMAARFKDAHLFFFDRFEGTKVATRLFGGKYLSFNGSDIGMNPLQMELNDINVDYLKLWLEMITDLHDPASKELFGSLITKLQYSPHHLRNLKMQYQTAFPATSQAFEQIKPWISDDQYGKIFCAAEDSLDLGGGKLVSFDFTTLLDPERKDMLGPAVVSYVMHKTMEITARKADPDPSIYFVDETAPMLRNPFFAAKFAAGLQEGRKLKQTFICAFQRPNAITESEHAQMILGQCPTQIIFPNSKAKEEDFEKFNLTANEMEFVLGKSHTHLPRRFLLRRIFDNGTESVVIDANMSVLGAGMKTFASGVSNVRLIERLEREDPENFRERYQQQMAEEFVSS